MSCTFCPATAVIFEPGRRSLCGRHHLFCPRRPPSSPRPSVLRASSARGTSLAPRLGGSGPVVTSSCRGPYAPELTWTGVQQAPAARPQGGPRQCWSLARRGGRADPGRVGQPSAPRRLKGKPQTLELPPASGTPRQNEPQRSEEGGVMQTPTVLTA